MNCNLNASCRCNRCRHLITVTTATITGGKLVLNVQPSQSFSNNENVCLLIATTLPSSTTPVPVVITIGSSTTQIPLRNKCGNNVYSDQIRNRRIYPTRFKTDVPSLNYVGTCNLPCTSFVFPVYTPTTPTETTAVETSITKKGEVTK